jgi:hypothetical protein
VANNQAPITFRLDVDYPYPSRKKSFFYVALGIKTQKSRDYLKNARIIARMINESPITVKAYWFFTPYTIPDKRLLDLLTPERHEVALHVVNNPSAEWKTLESQTGRSVSYYSIHGTSRFVAQLLWRRGIGRKQALIPSDFPLKSFHDRQTFGLDSLSYNRDLVSARKEADEWIKNQYILSIHPEWLFDKNKRSRRGPYYPVFRSILEVDVELALTKRAFATLAFNLHEYEHEGVPTDEFLRKLEDRGADIYTFLERKWCCPIANPPPTWKKEEDNVGMLEIKDFDSWWQAVGKKTRNMARKAEKSGIKVDVAQKNDKLAEGISKIYNETPIRQERAFPQYGEPLETVKGNMYQAKNSTYIGAYLEGELVGFIQLAHGDNITLVSNILALQKHWDKAINNAMLAKAVEVCAKRGERWLMYGRIGNHPSLDTFKENNGFVKYPISRFYVPITGKGNTAIKLGLHREIKDTLPLWLKDPLIPALNWVSRTKVKIRQ